MKTQWVGKCTNDRVHDKTGSRYTCGQRLHILCSGPLHVTLTFKFNLVPSMASQFFLFARPSSEATLWKHTASNRFTGLPRAQTWHWHPSMSRSGALWSVSWPSISGASAIQWSESAGHVRFDEPKTHNCRNGKHEHQHAHTHQQQQHKNATEENNTTRSRFSWFAESCRWQRTSSASTSTLWRRHVWKRRIWIEKQ